MYLFFLQTKAYDSDISLNFPFGISCPGTTRRREGSNVEHDMLGKNHFYRWNRKILNIYWFVFFFSTLVSLLNMLFTEKTPEYYLQHFVLFPAGIILGLMLLVETGHRCIKSVNAESYLILVAGTAIASALVAVHSTVSTMMAALFLPLVISMIYYTRIKVIFSLMTNLAAFFLLIWLHPVYKETISIIEAITTISIFIAGSILVLAVMSRQLEVYGRLEKTASKTRKLEELAKTDALTDLNNHRSFHTYLDELFSSDKPDSGVFQLALIDIDNFKQINDRYGHQTGDIILKRTSHKIRQLVETKDFAARYGGEEFAVVWHGRNLTEAFQAADRIRQAISRIRHPELNGKRITVSIGIKEFQHGDTKTVLFEGADIALYQAKRSGKNKTVIHFGGQSANERKDGQLGNIYSN